jgi:hypothetical protein
MKKSYVNCLIIAMCFSIFSTAWGQGPRPGPTPELRFRTNLNGAQEVTTPAGGVTTETRGRAQVRFNRGLSAATFEVVVRGGIGITQAHLHCAPAGVNGVVVVFLFDLVDPPPNAGGVLEVEGILDNSAIIPPADPADIEACGVPLNNIASLAFAMRNGKVYVNVHSTDFPAGVIRGQLLELD